MSKKNRNPDPLSVQVSFRLRLPKGTAITKKVLNDAYLSWVETGELPKSMEIRGIFWKNPARRGNLSDWRYSVDSDLSVMIPGYNALTKGEKALKRESLGIEDSPRGDHEEARETLQGALRTFRPF